MDDAVRAIGRTTLAKVTRRLIPFMFVLYIVAFVDRVNVGFAALQMKGFRLQRRGLRVWSGDLLHRVLPLRGAEQPDPGASRGAGLDRADYDHLGHNLGGDVPCAGAD